MIDLSIIMNIFLLQQQEIVAHVDRKQMNHPSYAKMNKKADAYLQFLSQDDYDRISSFDRYQESNKYSQYLFNYLVRQLNQNAQQHGSDEIIRVKDWHKGTVGYKNSLRNYLSPVEKNLVAEVCQMPFDPDNPALLNSEYETFEKTPRYKGSKKTLWNLDGLTFLPEHAHVLNLELAELMYPGIMIMATAFEQAAPAGLQFSIAYRLIANYLYDVLLVIDHVLQHFEQDGEESVLEKLLNNPKLDARDLNQFLVEQRNTYIELGSKLAYDNPRKDRMTHPLERDSQEMDDYQYLSALEYHYLEEHINHKELDERDIRNIQLKATELARSQSSKNHEEIMLVNEYPGDTTYKQLLQEPMTYLYTRDTVIAGEIRVFLKQRSGAIDLLLGHLEEDGGTEYFQPDFVLDRKAISRFKLEFVPRKTRNKEKKSIKPKLHAVAYGDEFGTVVNSIQTMQKERGYQSQLDFYLRGMQSTQHKADHLQEITVQPPIAQGIVYYDLAAHPAEVARQEVQLLVSLMHAKHMYKGDRIVMSHPDLPAVQLVLLGRS